MFFEKKVWRSPRPAQYAILAFMLVTLIIFLMNSGVSHKFWRSMHATKEIVTINYDTANRNFALNEEITTDFMAGEHASTLQILVRDPTPCFKKYAEQAISTEPFTSTKNASEEKITYFDMLSSFNKIMASLNIKVAVIEPSFLHCMLETKYKDLLARRNFSLTNFMGSDSIITYGIIGSDVNELQTKDSILKFQGNGFQPYFHRVPRADWMVQNNTRPELKRYTSHLFYSYYAWTIHVVIFQKRNGYLWHADLDSNDELSILHEKDFLFVNQNSAYENFKFAPLNEKWPRLANFYVPSDPQYFIFQIPSSRFLECNLTRAVEVKSDNSSKVKASDMEKFISKTIVSLHELKTIFNPLLLHYWIFSGTMLGWYRQCDIIPYTSDVDFAAWASEVEDLDYIIQQFLQNKKLKVVERMGMLEEALEFQLRSDNLRVDVFFMYKIKNGSWASGHRPSKGYYFRYHYPHFTLCSAELLQEKVQVPCETENVIATEYGPNWMTPVSSWYYESSIHNRGPNIYWDEKRRPKAFQEY